MAEPAGRLLFCNKVMDKTAMKQFIGGLVTLFGTVYTAHILDQLKTLGFQQATNVAMSLGIDDLLATPLREWLIRDAESQGFFDHSRYGNVHAVERLRCLIEAWYATSEYVKAGVNLNFRTTDPSNPVHVMSFSGARGNLSQIHQLLGMRGLMQDPEGQLIELPVRGHFREGLSLTEYIISCYGARKGIVDIAVRTADAGYLTRRLVEVVQRIVVRGTDCGSTRGITVSLSSQGRRDRTIFVARARLIGRVLASNVYVGARCVATRDQDIGLGLADQMMSLRARPLYVRSPLACNSIMFWICRLCYGWSLTHRGLVGLGEAVGIIAGQSIGEPGTQLTLRTFHTGGVFTGGTARHVRTPFTGTARYNEALVYLTRTRHGHPAWVCDDELSVAICNEYEVRHLIIPPHSLILVKNHQSVESKQVIAEVHTAAPAARGMVHKRIQSETSGELHVGPRVRGFGHAHSHVYMLPEASHLWVLSADKLHGSGGIRPIFHGARDRINAQTLLAGEDPTIPAVHPGGPWVSTRPPSGAVKYLEHLPGHDQIPKGLIKVPPLRSNRLAPRVLSPYGRPGRDIRGIRLLGPEITEARQRGKGSPRTVEYSIVPGYSNGDMAEDSVTARPAGDGPGNGITGMLVKKLEMVGKDDSSWISEDVRVSARDPAQSKSPSLVAFVGTPTSTSIRGCRSSGGYAGVRGHAGEGFSTTGMSTGGAVAHAGGHEDICHNTRYNFVIPPTIEILPGAFGSADWKYYSRALSNVEPPAASPGGPAAAVESNATRSKPNGSAGAASPDPLGNPDPRGEFAESEKEGATTAPLIEVKAYSSFVRYYMDHHPTGGARPAGSDNCGVVASFRYIFNVIVNRAGRFYDRRPMFGNKGILRASANKFRERAASLVLSPADASNVPLQPATICALNDMERATKGGNNAPPLAALTSPPRRNLAPRHSENRGNHLDFAAAGVTTGAPPPASSSPYGDPGDPARIAPAEAPPGVPGNPPNVNPLLAACIIRRSAYCRSIQGAPLWGEHSIMGSSNARGVRWWYLRGESITGPKLLTRAQTANSTYLYSRDSTQCSSASSIPCAKPCSAGGLGQLICGGAPAHGGGRSVARPPSRSYQVQAIGAGFAVIRFAELYLADGGATVHSSGSGAVRRGDTLMTLIYERLGLADTVPQGLPKIEQFLESRPGTSVSADLRDIFGDWSSSMVWLFGCLPGYLLSARISLERSKITLVDRIGRGYRSQGVQIADKHVEMIASRIAAKMSDLEDGMANAFLPGELIETSRARRRNRALGAGSTYRPVLLGVTGASLNTDSFLSEASFRDTTRVLARAAIRGQTDWLKGLKDNVVVGGTVPAGTSRGGVLRPVDPPDDKPEEVGTLGTEYPSTTMAEYLCFVQRRGGPEFRLPGSITVHNALALAPVTAADPKITTRSSPPRAHVPSGLARTGDRGAGNWH
nr:RNA polymerase beta'' subunit [Selaginella remotifolia]